MKTTCPKCKNEVEVISVEGVAKCPVCEEWFQDASSAFSAEVPEANRSAGPATGGSTSIRKTGDTCTAGARLLAMAGILVFLGSVITAILGTFFIPAWILSGALFSTAFWIYLLAQIIYIRANTEK